MTNNQTELVEKLNQFSSEEWSAVIEALHQHLSIMPSPEEFTSPAAIEHFGEEMCRKAHEFVGEKFTRQRQDLLKMLEVFLALQDLAK